MKISIFLYLLESAYFVTFCAYGFRQLVSQARDDISAECAPLTPARRLDIHEVLKLIAQIICTHFVDLF